jgi:hypothetical protein
MIPMTCPSCGRRGTVPPDRLNTRMHCKKCDAVFFMDRSGKIVMGDPGQIGRKGSKEAKQAKAAKGEKRYEEPFATSFTELLLKSPLWFKIGLGLALVFLVVQMRGGVKLPNWFGPPVANDAELRAAYVAAAFIDQEPEKIKKIAVPGTEADIPTWIGEFRPQFEPGIKSKQVLLTGGLVSQDNEKVYMIVNLLYPSPTPVPEVEAQKKAKASERRSPVEIGYKYDGSFTLPVIFKNMSGQWMFDAAETLEVTRSKPEKGDEKKK